MPEPIHITEEGRYHGRISDWKVDRAKNGGVVFIARCNCISKQNAVTKEYEPMEVPASILAWITLVTGAKAINVRQKEALMKSLGWTGRSLADLHKGAWGGKDLEFVIGLNDKGQTQVNWINAPGGLTETSQATLAELEGEWQALTSGVTVAPAAAAPAAAEDTPF
jgi:hypothetical protein